MQKYLYEKRDQTPNQVSQLTQLNKLTVITVWQWRLTAAMLMKVEEDLTVIFLLTAFPLIRTTGAYLTLKF